jgi:hypothetical protein
LEKGNLWIYLLPFIEQGNILRFSPGPSPRFPPIDPAPGDPNAIGSKIIQTYLCPSDPSQEPITQWTGGWVVGNYAANHDAFHNPNDGGWMSNWHVGKDSYTAKLGTSHTDGTSNTIGVAEAYAHCGGQGTLWAHETVTPDWHAMFNDWNARGAASKFQVQPTTAQCNKYIPQTGHNAGIQVMLMDASVRGLNASMDPNVWAAGLTPQGNEPVNLDQ